MSLQTFVEWEQKLALRRSVVLFVTLYMTWRSFTWAAEYASALLARGGSDAWVAAAAMVGAVTAPIAYLQKVVFEAYIASKEPQ